MDGYSSQVFGHFKYDLDIFRAYNQLFWISGWFRCFARAAVRTGLLSSGRNWLSGALLIYLLLVNFGGELGLACDSLVWGHFREIKEHPWGESQPGEQILWRLCHSLDWKELHDDWPFLAGTVYGISFGIGGRGSLYFRTGGKGRLCRVPTPSVLTWILRLVPDREIELLILGATSGI